MKLIPMRFCGVEWHHNPREIEFECEKNIAELHAPYNSSIVQDTGRKCLIVRGEGELYGEDCTEQFGRLLELFKQGKAGVLSIPKLEPIFAVFESPKIEAQPKPDVLTYSFVFREVMDKKQSAKRIFCVTKNGEDLWDIAYAYSIDINELVRLNPQIRRPDIVEDGSVIVLC